MYTGKQKAFNVLSIIFILNADNSNKYTVLKLCTKTERSEVLMAVPRRLPPYGMPCSLLGSYQYFGGTCHIHLLGKLKMETAGSSEMLVIMRVIQIKLAHSITSE
jgi:hypothetical protein